MNDFHPSLSLQTQVYEHINDAPLVAVVIIVFVFQVHLHLSHCLMNNPGTNNEMSPVMRKLAFCVCENKGPDQLRGYRAVTAQLISTFVFAV